MVRATAVRPDGDMGDVVRGTPAVIDGIVLLIIGLSGFFVG